MEELTDFGSIARRSVYAHTIGEQALEYLMRFDPQRLADEADSSAMALVESIRLVLEDTTLDDPTCFSRIDAIVDAFSAAGIYVSRHDE